MQIEVIESSAMSGKTRDDVQALCCEAYEEDLAETFADVGPGTHFLLRVNDILVSHAMLVTRTLQPQGERALRTAYVELVATRPGYQRRGFATDLLEELVPHIESFDIGALSPFDVAFYERIGWELWYGPLSVRTASGDIPTPDESVMIRRVPRTPATLRRDVPLSVEWRPGEVW